MFKRFRLSRNINNTDSGTPLNDLGEEEKINFTIHSDRNSRQSISISKRNSKNFSQLFFRNSIKNSEDIKEDKSCKIVFDEKTKESMLKPYKIIRNINEKILQIQQERRQELVNLNASNGNGIKSLIAQYKSKSIDDKKILQIQQERRQELEKLNANKGMNVKNLVLQFSKNGITSI